MPSAIKTKYDAQGFVVVPDLIDRHTFLELTAACDRAISRTRSGSWPHRRTVGKQFPPYGDDHPDSWGIQHVMHPDLAEHIFADWYTSDALVGVVTELLECQEDHLQMELFNVLINPVSHNFALRWHRDDVRGDVTEEEERQALKLWHHGVQWNTALYADSCLYVVPRSHNIVRTLEQRVRSSTHEPPSNPLDMPGAIEVVLQPGETVFYNSNILHCGTYSTFARRATLHASMGDSRGGSARARNVLQHGLKWMAEARFRDGLSVRGQKMLDRLLIMERSVDDTIGYSLEN